MDLETKLKWLDFNSWYGLYPRRHNMDTINAYINEIIRKEREYTEKSLAEIVEKYDFIVCSTECMNQLREILPEGAKIAYSPYIGDPGTVYIIKKFDMMDLLNEALKERIKEEEK